MDGSVDKETGRWLIVGLGNPGKRYEHTRHNVGFEVIDLLADRWRIAVDKRTDHGLVGVGRLDRHAVVLLKPTTYMNRSGQAVVEVMDFYKLPPGQVLVIYDDMAMPLGRLRIRAKGSAGGHKGMIDIITRLGTEEFPRLRIGVDQPGGTDAVDYVLSRFPAEQRPVVEAALTRAADAVEAVLNDGLEQAMTNFNRPMDGQM